MLGLGENFVNLAENDRIFGRHDWVRQKCKLWIEEGEGRAERIGRYYGCFGYEKGSTKLQSGHGGERHVLAGDIANVVVAYVATKVKFDSQFCEMIDRTDDRAGTFTPADRTVSLSVP